MPTSDQYNIVNLPNIHVLRVIRNNPIEFEVEQRIRVHCPRCQSSRLRLKDRFIRKVRHESFGTRQCVLHLRSRKFLCLQCRRYFHERFGGIRKYFRVTESFRKEVCHKHHGGITASGLSQHYGIGWSTVERWYHEFLDFKLREKLNEPAPRVLGIDEHFFTRKKGYATTLCNLSRRKVHDVVLGRSEASLQGYLNRMKDRHRTKIIVMDLSTTYRSIARRYFPEAQIVADRFHVIRLVNQQFMETWKLLDPVGRKNRGLLSLMRRHHHNLSTEQKRKLRRYLCSVAGLEIIYDFKQSLARLLLMKHKTQKQCRELIPQFLEKIQQLRDSGFHTLQTLGSTLDSWKYEIVRMWRFSKTNGITEGLHNKMEMISRRAFGFRNFQNYRMRVKVLCG